MSGQLRPLPPERAGGDYHIFRFDLSRYPRGWREPGVYLYDHYGPAGREIFFLGYVNTLTKKGKPRRRIVTRCFIMTADDGRYVRRIDDLSPPISDQE